MFPSNKSSWDVDVNYILILTLMLTTFSILIIHSAQLVTEIPDNIDNNKPLYEYSIYVSSSHSLHIANIYYDNHINQLLLPWSPSMDPFISPFRLSLTFGMFVFLKAVMFVAVFSRILMTFSLCAQLQGCFLFQYQGTFCHCRQWLCHMLACWLPVDERKRKTNGMRVSQNWGQSTYVTNGVRLLYLRSEL